MNIKLEQTSRQLEKMQPGIFHIHIDAQELSPALYHFAIEKLGFYDSDFDGHPEGYVHFEPQKHLTLKLKTKQEFTSVWEQLEKEAEKHSWTGYLEGEYIPIDDYIPYKAYTELPVPFHIKRRRLDPQQKEEFRQTEIHLTYKKEESDERLTQKLLTAGLYGAYIPKKDGLFVVLTVQGYIRDIHKLIPVLKNYVLRSGGAYRCTLKEERAIKNRLFGIGIQELPEVAERVEVF